MTNAHTFNRNEFLNSSSHHFKMFPYRFLLYYFFPYLRIFYERIKNLWTRKKKKIKNTHILYTKRLFEGKHLNPCTEHSRRWRWCVFKQTIRTDGKSMLQLFGCIFIRMLWGPDTFGYIFHAKMTWNSSWYKSIK